jgi:hypothetical protein
MASTTLPKRNRLRSVRKREPAKKWRKSRTNAFRITSIGSTRFWIVKILKKRERGVEALKKVINDKFVIKPNEIPESAFLLEQRIARELGYGTVELTEEFKKQKTAEIINNQTRSLDKWIDYLSSSDATYPDWAKYWAFRSMLDMGKLLKEEDEDGGERVRFQKRTKDTVAAFPPMNPRALAETISQIKKRIAEKAKPKEEQTPVENKSVKLSDQEFRKLLSTEDFSKIYAQFLVEMPEYSTEGLQEIRGEWIKYEQGSDGAPLVQSLEGHPLEWCTANLDTANTQLQGGDFYIYYSVDASGKPLIPRAAIRMQENHIAEVRGIAPDQNVDPYIAPVIEAKMKEFGAEGDAYKKKSADMEQVTELEDKTRRRINFTKDDLMFIYEINAPIEGFGYQRDPRVEELRAARNPEEDMPIVFECTKDQIARNVGEIKKDTKAYFGSLVPGIFDRIQQYAIEHVYTSFPDGRIRKEMIEVGGKDAETLTEEMREKDNKSSGYAESMMRSGDFASSVSEASESQTFFRLKVGDLGFPKGKFPTTDEIYRRIEELGLELCPADTGPRYRLQYQNQPLGEWVYIGMKQIAASGGPPSVFRVGRREGGLWLDDRIARPDGGWRPEGEVLFRLRKLKTLET